MKRNTHTYIYTAKRGGEFELAVFCAVASRLAMFHLVPVEQHQPLQPKYHPGAVGLEAIHGVPF